MRKVYRVAGRVNVRYSVYGILCMVLFSLTILVWYGTDLSATHFGSALTPILVVLILVTTLAMVKKDAYLGQFLRPSWRKFIITAFVVFVLPFPIYSCPYGCKWELMWIINLVFPGLFVVIAAPASWFAMVIQFFVYVAVTYVCVSLILRRSKNP